MRREARGADCRRQHSFDLVDPLRGSPDHTLRTAGLNDLMLLFNVYPHVVGT